jgi:hypothetical protein
MQQIKLQRVYHMPRVLEPDTLYVSEEFGIAGQLCACGCGNKTITPLGPTDWELTIKNGKPTLEPSIGNWPLPCQAHYFIREGAILWSSQWTEEEIIACRKREMSRREVYYKNLQIKPQKRSLLRGIFERILKIFR